MQKAQRLPQADYIGETGLDFEQCPLMGHRRAVLNGFADDDRLEPIAIGISRRRPVYSRFTASNQ
jgi:hypothetical protein